MLFTDGNCGSGGDSRLSAVAAEYQGWLLGASGVMLALGLVQLRAVKRSCARRSYSSVIIFCLSAVIVLAVAFFPHVIAEAMAGLRR